MEGEKFNFPQEVKEKLESKKALDMEQVLKESGPFEEWDVTTIHAKSKSEFHKRIKAVALECGGMCNIKFIGFGVHQFKTAVTFYVSMTYPRRMRKRNKKKLPGEGEFVANLQHQGR